MKDAKETKKVIFYLAVIGSVIIVTAIIDIVMSVVNLSLLGYVIYCWKSDMSELRKRIPLSIVFASWMRVSSENRLVSGKRSNP